MSVSGSDNFSDTSLANSPGQVNNSLHNGWVQVSADITSGEFNTVSTNHGGYSNVATAVRHGFDSVTYNIPESAQAQLVRVRIKIGANKIAGSESVNLGVLLQGLSIIATRKLTASTIGSQLSTLNADSRENDG